MSLSHISVNGAITDYSLELQMVGLETSDQIYIGEKRTLQLTASFTPNQNTQG